MKKEPQTFILSSVRHTKVNFKSLDKKILDAIIAGKDFWITSKSQVQIKQENEPVPVNDAIELFVSLKQPVKEKPIKQSKKKK